MAEVVEIPQNLQPETAAQRLGQRLFHLLLSIFKVPYSLSIQRAYPKQSPVN